MEYLHKKGRVAENVFSPQDAKRAYNWMPVLCGCHNCCRTTEYIPISGEILADSKNSYEICYIVAHNHSNGSQPAAAANSATCLFIIQVLQVQPAEIWTAKLEFISIQNLYIESYLLK